MRGSKTGVYIGVSGSEAAEAFSRDPEELLGYSMTGCQHAMLANRLSYFFDFTGMHTLFFFVPIKHDITEGHIEQCFFVLFIKKLIWSAQKRKKKRLKKRVGAK